MASALMVCIPAVTAEPDWAAPLRKYVSSSAYLEDIGRAIAGLERLIAPGCTRELKGMQRRELRIVAEPVFFGALPIPQGGQWREQMAIDRCGETVLHNVLVSGIEGDSPHLTLLLPGSSKADGKLQYDASEAAFAIAGARAGRKCREGARRIVDTRFVRYLGRSAEAAPAERLWREVWTVRLCDSEVRVQIDFAPDGKGSFTFRADLPQSSP
ncbi:MAG: hypothetical protein ACMVY4_10355 [Minwuia sp.]|uniref:hypothetical protein n=1 Tax=Minwuia sp. TaxID=2493630 RepID=UPI003A884783